MSPYFIFLFLSLLAINQAINISPSENKIQSQTIIKQLDTFNEKLKNKKFERKEVD